MRRRITSLLAALALLCTLLPQFALPVRAEDVSGACGNNLIWTLNRDTGALTVSGSGRMADGWWNADNEIEDIPWYPYLDEIVTVTIGQGVTSMFTFGQNFGWIQGVLQAYGISYELVRPQKWKREYSITGDKNTAIAVCKRLFPDVSLYPSSRCRKESDGMAEALLMAEYARRKL